MQYVSAELCTGALPEYVLQKHLLISKSFHAVVLNALPGYTTVELCTGALTGYRLASQLIIPKLYMW